MIGLTPHLTTVAVYAHGVVGLAFDDSVSGDVEVLSRMNRPVFERARTADGFAAAELDPESGTVHLARRRRSRSRHALRARQDGGLAWRTRRGVSGGFAGIVACALRDER